MERRTERKAKTVKFTEEPTVHLALSGQDYDRGGGGREPEEAEQDIAQRVASLSVITLLVDRRVLEQIKLVNFYDIEEEVIADFGVYIGEADEAGAFQPADLLLAVEATDCLEANLLSVEARLAKLLSTQEQVTLTVGRVQPPSHQPSS